MNTQTAMERSRNWLETHPKTALTINVVGTIGLAALVAFTGYRSGVKAGIKKGVKLGTTTGQEAGYALALKDMDITSDDIVEALKAKAESQAAISTAMSPIAVPA